MTKEEIIAYVIKTPDNVNPWVLGAMIDALLEDQGGEKTEEGDDEGGASVVVTKRRLK